MFKAITSASGEVKARKVGPPMVMEGVGTELNAQSLLTL